MLIERIYSFEHNLNIETVYYVDVVVSCLAKLCSPLFSSHVASLEIASSIVFLICIYAYRRIGFKSSHASSICAAFLLTATLFLITHAYPTFLLLYPLAVLIALNKIVEEQWTIKGLVPGILKLVIEAYCLYVSGPLAFLYYLISFLMASKKVTLVSMAMCVYALIVSFYTSLDVRIFDYPEQSRFADISSFLRVGEIIFGEERVPFTATYGSYVNQNSLSLLILVILCSSYMPRLVRGIMKKKGNDQERVTPESLLLVLIAFSVSSFFFLQDTSRYINSPEATLYKIVPGLIWRFSPTLVPALVWICFYLTCVSLLSYSERYKAHLLSVVVCIAVVYVKYIPSVMSFQRITDNMVIPVENTPSHYVLRSYSEGVNIIPRIKAEFERVFEDGHACKVEVSRNSESAEHIFDAKARTVWNTKGNQLSGDFISVRCDTSFSFDRLRLVAPATDFPRAFKIETSQFDNEFKMLKKFEKWNGALGLTREDYPYFLAQGEVTVHFSRTIDAHAVKITLLEGEKTFDWSVSELVFEKIKHENSSNKNQALNAGK